MVEAGANEISEAEILDALDIAHWRDQEDLRASARAGREGRQGEDADRGAQGRRGPARAGEGIARRGARRGHAGRGQARAPGRLQGGRDGDPRAVRPRRVRWRRRGRAEGRQGAQRGRPARLRQAGEGDHPRAHRGPQEAPRRSRGGRDPRHHDRSGRHAAHARLGPVHARADAGAERRRAGDAQGGDAPRHARPADQEVLLPPLQLPALLGGRGGPPGPQASRHRSRRAGRACARAGGALDRGLPLHDPCRLGHLRVQRLLLDGLGVRLLAVPDGRGRADQAPGGGHRDGPHQGGRRLHRAHRHRGRGGPPRRHGLQGGGHRPRDHGAADGHQDLGRHVRDPQRRAHPGAQGHARSSSARWPR